MYGSQKGHNLRKHKNTCTTFRKWPTNTTTQHITETTRRALRGTKNEIDDVSLIYFPYIFLSCSMFALVSYHTRATKVLRGQSHKKGLNTGLAWNCRI